MTPPPPNPRTQPAVEFMTSIPETKFELKEKPRRLGRPRVFLGLLAAATALVGAGCKKEAQAPPPPPVVQVMEVTPTNVPLFAEFIGQLDSPQNVEVRARVEAFVDKMLFTEGTEVKEGDPLFEFDKKPSLERLSAANGMLAEAKAALTNTKKTSPASSRWPRSERCPSRTWTTPSPPSRWARPMFSPPNPGSSPPRLTSVIAT
jgi:hypothetical protein